MKLNLENGYRAAGMLKETNRMRQRAEDSTGLEILPVCSRDGLQIAEEMGLSSVYCDIFAEKPYREKFEKGDVRAYFNGLVDAGGFIFVAGEPRKGGLPKLTAFVASQPLPSKQNVVEVVRPYVDVQKSTYFAEDAVVPDQRRRGISRDLKRLLLCTNATLGYQTMVLRTSRDSFQQAAAVRQLGGQQIDGLYQDVDALRLDGRVTPDKRMFFTFDLTAPNALWR